MRSRVRESAATGGSETRNPPSGMRTGRRETNKHIGQRIPRQGLSGYYGLPAPRPHVGGRAILSSGKGRANNNKIRAAVAPPERSTWVLTLGLLRPGGAFASEMKPAFILVSKRCPGRRDPLGDQPNGDERQQDEHDCHHALQNSSHGATWLACGTSSRNVSGTLTTAKFTRLAALPAIALETGRAPAGSATTTCPLFGGVASERDRQFMVTSQCAARRM